MRHWIVEIPSLIVLLNALYAGLLVWLLHRREPYLRFLAMVAMAWMAMMCGLMLVQIGAPLSWEPFLRRWFYFPLGVEMVWNLLFLPALTPVIALVALALRLFGPVAREEKPAMPAGLSRRKFIRLVAVGAAPSAALGMGVHGSLTSHDLRAREFRVPVAGLPPELEGFKIAHISDLHSGIFCGPARLRIIREMSNDLKADLVAITGDIINRDMAEFPDARASILGIGSRYGTYLCEGNHDRIPGPGLMAKACGQSHLPFLFNANAIIPVNGRRIILGGLPWMNSGFEGKTEWVSRLFPERREGDVRILLAHHPHLFDIAQSADLVLSGHTHGGQIMVGESAGLGPLFFKYWSGFYRRGQTVLIVSNGCGDWFPCRVGAPAEVGLLTLSAAKREKEV
ncbi:MAG TPA: metallophosphoesterase [Candidatus Methylacidiphilales bacterium]|nr:metallophosphoesterase [Candidatus Methylacidiphilales bacterium]